jgi:hypothetical protein
VECTRGGGSGGGPCAIDAHRQTHQCRVPDGGLDPACQHHDAGAWRGSAAVGAALDVGGSQCAIAVTAPGFDANGWIGRGQKAGCAEIFARNLRAGSACAGGVSSRGSGSRSAGSCSVERLILSKPVAAR